jgi:hypothetical protein
MDAHARTALADTLRALAVLRYEARLALASGNDTVHCWHTDHYELRGAQWQAVWSQATEIWPPA